jgi:hypothetical protein
MRQAPLVGDLYIDAITGSILYYNATIKHGKNTAMVIKLSEINK